MRSCLGDGYALDGGHLRPSLSLGTCTAVSLPPLSVLAARLSCRSTLALSGDSLPPHSWEMTCAGTASSLKEDLRVSLSPGCCCLRTLFCPHWVLVE